MVNAEIIVNVPYARDIIHNVFNKSLGVPTIHGSTESDHTLLYRNLQISRIDTSVPGQCLAHVFLYPLVGTAVPARSATNKRAVRGPSVWLTESRESPLSMSAIPVLATTRVVRAPGVTILVPVPVHCVAVLRVPIRASAPIAWFGHAPAPIPLGTGVGAARIGATHRLTIVAVPA
jgi:hypothetical protein